MITYGSGNILNADTDALVNTVNTVGIMGKGIALQFKLAYPDMYKKYVSDCKQNRVELQKMHVYRLDAIMRPYYIINFPTKAHWKSNSQLADIEGGLHDLARVIDEYGITSIAIPPLGCGLGGLQWSQVLPLITRILEPLSDVNIIIYPPAGSPSSQAIVTSDEHVSLTVVRATIVELISRYNQIALCSTRLEAQKLLYFATEAGIATAFDFEKKQFGPYSRKLHQAIIGLEGRYIKGYGDGCGGLNSGWAQIMTVPAVLPEVRNYLADYPTVMASIERVERLVTGFETPLGMELLATIHWIITRENPNAGCDIEMLTSEIGKWARRKAKLFKPDHIEMALSRLREEGWIPS